MLSECFWFTIQSVPLQRDQYNTILYMELQWLGEKIDQKLHSQQTHHSMMTSSNGNTFRVTGHLCGEFTGPGEFPAQRPVTRSFDVFFDPRLNKRLSKQPWGWWFETPLWSLWDTLDLSHPWCRIIFWYRTAFYLDTGFDILIPKKNGDRRHIKNKTKIFPFPSKFHCNMFLGLDKNSALVQVMAWRGIGD